MKASIIKGNMEGVLTRSEMKSITAGGNIYCHSGNVQIQCSDNNLEDCLDACVWAFGDNCQGCAQFFKIA